MFDLSRFKDGDELMGCECYKMQMRKNPRTNEDKDWCCQLLHISNRLHLRTPPCCAIPPKTPICAKGVPGKASQGKYPQTPNKRTKSLLFLPYKVCLWEQALTAYLILQKKWEPKLSLIVWRLRVFPLSTLCGERGIRTPGTVTRTTV